MDACHERYGDTFTLRVRRGRPWVFLTNPSDIKQVFTSPPEAVGAGAGEANPLLGPLLGRTSVMLRDEPDHMIDRKRLLPSFHGERMRAYGEMMTDVAVSHIERWPLGEPFPLWPRMQAVSLEVVMRAVFGNMEGERMEKLRKRLVEMTEWVNDPRRLAMIAAFGQGPVEGRKGFREVMAPVEELVRAEVYERRARAERPEEDGILAVLEAEYRQRGEVMPDKKMRDELVTMLSDGPTATSLAWVFQQLLAQPEKLQRLQAEIEVGESEEYLDAVVKETLRLCPTVPVVMRRLVEPMRAGGYEIPAGVIVAPCVYLTHLREDLYENARSFEPERFIDDNAGAYSWIPFGGGPRRCVAASFAPLEMKCVIRAVLLSVELTQGASGVERAKRSSVSFAPDAGAMVIARRRDSRNALLAT
jgi:cytochrome P450 family 135